MRSRRLALPLALSLVAALAACQRETPPPELSPLEKEAKARAECHVMAVSQSQFDPTMAEAPPQTISETKQAGGDVVGSGAIAGGAAKGALVGVAAGAVAGDAGKGAAAGAVAGGLIGGMRRRQETKKMVTTTRTNPEYTAYLAKKEQYRQVFDACLTARLAPPAAPAPK